MSGLEVGSGCTAIHKIEKIPALMEEPDNGQVNTWMVEFKFGIGAVKEINFLLQQSRELVKEGSVWR